MGHVLKTTIVAIEELPTTPETLWLRLLAKGRTQEAAIAELLILPESDPKRSSALDLLVSWRINMEIMQEVEQEGRQILMALSQAYLEWEKQTERRGRERGLEQGLEQERRAAIASLIQYRFGAIDAELEAIMPKLMELGSSDYTQVLLQLSKEELIQRFGN